MVCPLDFGCCVDGVVAVVEARDDVATFHVVDAVLGKDDHACTLDGLGFGHRALEFDVVQVVGFADLNDGVHAVPFCSLPTTMFRVDNVLMF